LSFTVPQIISGTLTGGIAQTFTAISPANRQLLVENTDNLNNFTVKINGSTIGWTLLPGTRLGYSPIGGIDTIVLTPSTGTNTTFQVMLG